MGALPLGKGTDTSASGRRQETHSATLFRSIPKRVNKGQPWLCRNKLDELPARVPNYPGSDKRFAAFDARFPDAERHGSSASDAAGAQPVRLCAGLTPETVRVIYTPSVFDDANGPLLNTIPYEAYEASIAYQADVSKLVRVDHDRRAMRH